MYQRYRYPNAKAKIMGGEENPYLHGEMLLFQKEKGVLVKVKVTGLPPSPTGFFALHIHEGSSCTGTDFSDTKGHYNPGGAPHPGHAGDLPPLLSFGGNAYLAVMTDRFSVKEVLGKTVVIHAGRDDFSSQPAGDAGQKIACGVIRKSAV